MASTTTYSSDPTSNKDKLRLLLFDTDVSNAIWTDQELEVFLSMADSNFYSAAARAVRALALNKGKSAIMYRLAETIRVDKREMPRILMQMARDFDRAAENDPGSVVEFVDAFAIAFDPVTGADVSEYVTDLR